MWSIRPRDKCTTPDAQGSGDFVLDFDRTVDPFAAGPISTIAWRIGHLASTCAGRYEWTFGARAADPGDFEFSPNAGQMFRQLWAEIDRWVSAVEAMSNTDLDEPGYGQYPWGLDPELPFIGIVRWMNRETIHHLAEVALLRDLYARMR